MRNLTLCAVIFALASTPAAAQQSRPPATGFNAKWTPLFNGTDLTGWKVVGPERWTVDDGTILGEGIHGQGGFLKTEKKYKNFHAFLRFKCETPNNSGFFYHSDIEEDISKIRFIQVEISSSIGGHTGGLHGDNISEADGRGWIVWPAPELETVLRPFDWNEMLVEVEGNRIRTHLNGVQMIDFTYPNPRNTDGIIALQIHPGKPSRIRFKDIWVRDLDERRPE